MQRFERIYKDAKLPTRKTARSAGYDMYCYKDTEIPPVYSLKINGSDMTSWLSGPSIISILLSQVYDKMHLGAFEITFYMHTTISYYITLFRVCQ